MSELIPEQNIQKNMSSSQRNFAPETFVIPCVRKIRYLFAVVNFISFNSILTWPLFVCAVKLCTGGNAMKLCTGGSSSRQNLTEEHSVV